MDKTDEQKIQAFLDAYKEAKEALLAKCYFIAEKMYKVNKDYGYLDTYHLDIEEGEIQGEGTTYAWGDRESHYGDINIDWLTKTNDEIVQCVQDELDKEKKERERIKKTLAERERLNDMKEFERLKKKLGL